MRINRQQMMMEIAHVVSKRSTCVRLNVGAVIAVNNRVVSLGWNGQPPGHPHCSGGCGQRPGLCNTIHAEANAIAHLPDGVLNTDKVRDLYVTHSPCLRCAQSILATAIDRVFFSIPYRDETPLGIILQQQVPVYQVTPAGYVLDWATRTTVTL